MNETLKRALSGAVYVVLLLGCISYSREGLAILFGAFLVIGVYEFCKMCGLNFYVSIPIAAGSYYYLWNKNSDLNINTALTAISIVTSIKLLLYLFNANKSNFKIYTRYFLLFGYVILPFIIANYVAMGVKGYNPKILISIIVLIWTNDTFAYLVGKNIGKNKLFPSVSPKKTIEGFAGGLVFTIIGGALLANYVAMGVKGYNPKILISIIILIWTNDTFAYLVGKNIGKNKLFPSVSPKKTIEGFAGGLVFTVIVGALLANYYIMASTLYIWIVIAAIVSIFSTLGDLIESKLKRVAGIKDTGNIMPGHGGILDRLDSIIFVIPFINLFYLILYYVS